ncbi:thermonuclease family protein [Niallia sp. HCP3S3_B10]|uniref:thermonuclease family protein n=1 Tax=Niallia sp. HCP3S3_B10 TaxID=3438944 RepID=UPI003F8B5F1C
MKKIISTLFILFLLSGCSTDSLVTYQAKENYKTDNQVEKEISFKKYFNEVNRSSEKAADIKTEKHKAIVKKVIDADTLVLEADKYTALRLIGINGPEITKGKNEPFGQEGKEYLANLIEGKEITYQLDPNADEKDKYGRILAHVFLDQISIQSYLLKEGYVKLAYLFDEYEFIDVYKDAENIAKEKKLNIWSIPGYADTDLNGFVK